MRGEKTTTSGLLEGREAPNLQPGARLALLGFDDEPLGVVEVTDVRVVPAGQIDLQFARDEGEGFESVEQWRDAHERFFEQPIDDETEVVAVWFRLVERT